MQEIQLPRYQSVHQTIQLKINELLNKNTNTVNLINQQFLQQQIQNGDLNVYLCSNHFECYHEPCIIPKSLKAILVKNNTARQNKGKQKVYGIVGFGWNNITFLRKNQQSQKMILKYKQTINLNKNQQIVSMSEIKYVNGERLSFAITNQGHRYLCIFKDQQLIVNNLQNSSNSSSLNIFKFIVKPFTPPNRFYLYSKIVVSQIKQQDQTVYFYSFYDFLIQYTYLKLTADRQLGLRCQKILNKWQLNLDTCLQKQRLKNIWSIDLLENYTDQSRILIGCELEDKQGKNISVLLLVQINYITPSINKNLICWQIPFQCDYKLTQIIIHQSFIYLLVGGIKPTLPYSILFELGIEGLQVIRKYFVPQKSSLSKDDWSILLLTQCQTYVVKKDKITKKDGIYMANIIKRQIEQDYKTIQRNSKRFIQKQFELKNYYNIIKILQNQKNQISTYKNTLQKQQSDLQSEIFDTLDQEILIIDIRIQLLCDIVELQHSQEIFPYYSNAFYSQQYSSIKDVLLCCIKKKFYKQFINVVQKVLIPFSKYSESLKNSINCDYYELIKKCLKQFDQQYLGDYQNRLIRALVQLKPQQTNFYRQILKKGKQNLLKELLNQFQDQKLFQLIFCETRMVSNQQFKDYIKYLKSKCTQSQIENFLITLVNHHISCIRYRSQCKVDLSYLLMLQEQQFKMIYNYLQTHQRKIALILGLRMKFRQTKQIINIAVNLQQIKNTDFLFKVISDKIGNQYEKQDIMIKICSHLKIRYMSLDSFQNMFISRDPFFQTHKIPPNLWQLVKKYLQGQKSNIYIKQIQKNIKLND